MLNASGVYNLEQTLKSITGYEVWESALMMPITQQVSSAKHVQERISLRHYPSPVPTPHIHTLLDRNPVIQNYPWKTSQRPNTHELTPHFRTACCDIQWPGYPHTSHTHRVQTQIFENLGKTQKPLLTTPGSHSESSVNTTKLLPCIPLFQPHR